MRFQKKIALRLRFVLFIKTIVYFRTFDKLFIVIKNLTINFLRENSTFFNDNRSSNSILIFTYLLDIGLAINFRVCPLRMHDFFSIILEILIDSWNSELMRKKQKRT